MDDRPKVLVIDDEESIRFTFENFLADEGFSVSTARDYHEALVRLDEADFDLIFADVLLGGRTGIDVIREIRGRNLTSLVVIVTGAPNIESVSDALRLGAFDYISKPVNQETLIHIAKMALKHKTVMDEREKYRSNLEAIFRSVKDAIITVDREMKIVELNESATKICGLDRDSIGKVFSVLPIGCKKNCLSALVETIDKKCLVEVDRLECVRKNRSGHVVDISTSPLLDHQGLFRGAVIVARDETRLAHLERDLKERQHFHNLIGGSSKMQEIYSLIESLADVQTTVLVTGESGTGKELVAEALHFKGARSGKPLVKVHCAALSENLLESELFGHVKGAFTGAVKDKIGRFQRADGGTIFLDEMSDMPQNVQLRLLRVLQSMEFERVGDSTPTKVNVRIIAATNKDLSAKVKTGEFREDLFYRLNVIEIGLPPLRDRLEDVPFLVDHFLKKFNKKLNRDISSVSADVINTFMDYPWPGNIRELEHTLEHAFIVCHRDTITVDHLPRSLRDFTEAKSEHNRDQKKDESMSILWALEKAGGNKAKASRLLSIDRKTLYRKIKKYKI
jgi:two-component system, NtrC family, response regulator HydG